MTTNPKASCAADASQAPGIAQNLNPQGTTPVRSVEGERVAELEAAARRWNALMRVGKIKMQGSAGVNPHTLERNGNNVHFGAEFWPEPPKPEYAALDGGEHSTAWGKACLTALADAVLEREAALPKPPLTGGA